MAKKGAEREGPDRFVLRPKPTAVFLAAALPNTATHCDQSECGFSLYRGVLVRWDEDCDTRVLNFIDDRTKAERRELLVVQEHEGCIKFLWRSTIPSRLARGCNITVSVVPKSVRGSLTTQAHIGHPFRCR